MLNQSARLDDEAGVATPVLQGSAERLPFADGSFDVVVSAFGALPFVADAAAALTEVRRVLVPHGRCVASVMHPLRWVFPDSPDPATLTVATSYFDRTPYVEEDRSGRAVYTEHHRTVGDWIRAVRQAGMVLEDLVEPEWSPERGSRWGAWSPERGALIPGTAILVLHRD
jgi:ubiquinone/menaquinone biosynthesis C-methylase UbiE